MQAKESETERPECGSGHFIVCDSCKKERRLKKKKLLVGEERELHEGKRKQSVGTKWAQWQLRARRGGWRSVRLSEQIFLSV